MIADHICGQRPSPLCDGIIRAFKTISAALSSWWCLVIKPLSCSLSSCSVNQGVARHVTVWRIALCNTVISARSPPTQPAAMGPGSQPPAACYYHNPAAWVLSASDLLRHEQLQPAAHNKHSFCSFLQLCGKHRTVKSLSFMWAQCRTHNKHKLNADDVSHQDAERWGHPARGRTGALMQHVLMEVLSCGWIQQNLSDFV